MTFYEIDRSKQKWWKRPLCWLTLHHKYYLVWDSIEGWCELYTEDECIRCGKTTTTGAGIYANTNANAGNSHW